MVSSNLFNAVNAIRVDHGFVTSDHFPVSVLFDLSSIAIRVECNDNYIRQPKIPWGNLSQDDLSKYNQRTDYNFKSIVLNHPLLF